MDLAVPYGRHFFPAKLNISLSPAPQQPPVMSMGVTCAEEFADLLSQRPICLKLVRHKKGEPAAERGLDNCPSCTQSIHCVLLWYEREQDPPRSACTLCANAQLVYW